jgi:hypothetical protein
MRSKQNVSWGKVGGKLILTKYSPTRGKRVGVKFWARSLRVGADDQRQCPKRGRGSLLQKDLRKASQDCFEQHLHPIRIRVYGV